MLIKDCEILSPCSVPHPQNLLLHGNAVTSFIMVVQCSRHSQVTNRVQTCIRAAFPAVSFHGTRECLLSVILSISFHSVIPHTDIYEFRVNRGKKNINILYVLLSFVRLFFSVSNTSCSLFCKRKRRTLPPYSSVHLRPYSVPTYPTFPPAPTTKHRNRLEMGEIFHKSAC